jgi:ribosomal protein L37AE/L43A
MEIKTKEQLQKKIKALGKISEEQKKSIICSLIGHSNITETCFGYVNCARCGEQIGDTLGGYYPKAKEQVIVDHECDTCKENWKNMTWKDKFMVEYSLDKKEVELKNI